MLNKPLKRICISIIVFCTFGASASKAGVLIQGVDSLSIIKKNDPFIPYLKSIPRVLQTLSSTNSGSGDSAITTKEIVFASKNNINKVYAIMAYPRKAGKYPAILFLHGGSGNAAGLRELIEKFASKGYVALACDMPGYCDIDNTPHSTGPWKAHDAPDEKPRFNIAAGLQNSSLVDAEVAGLEAFNLLASQNNVDAKNIGITGFSWGGYSTTMLSGLLGERVKAAYSYWGCGFYDKGSFWKELISKLPEEVRKRWLTWFDAGRRAKNIRANYFIEAASNDTYFWPDAVSATLNAIPGAKNHVWGPNVNHSLVPTSAPMQELYFNYHLKGTGNPFAEVKITQVKDEADGSKKVTIKLKEITGAPVSVKLYYSIKDTTWQKREWLPINALLQKGNTYKVVIPAAIVAKQINFFAHIIDSRNVLTSSDLY